MNDDKYQKYDLEDCENIIKNQFTSFCKIIVIILFITSRKAITKYLIHPRLYQTVQV